MISPAALFGKGRIISHAAETASVFMIQANSATQIRQSKVDGFTCPTYEVGTDAIPGHPRELARKIAYQ